jgi:hypothetical protein
LLLPDFFRPTPDHFARKILPSGSLPPAGTADTRPAGHPVKHLAARKFCKYITNTKPYAVMTYEQFGLWNNNCGSNYFIDRNTTYRHNLAL